MRENIKSFLLFLRSNLISSLGALITTLSFSSIVMLIIYEQVNGPLYPLADMVVYTILPGGFILGLILIPAGIWIRLKKARKRGDENFLKMLRRDFIRQIIPVISILTIINVVFIGVVSYQGYHFMDSTRFCGQLCHKVMNPEYTRYLKSPHARVQCVECHIGEGASWFVKSKISGARQVYAVLTNSYSRPIPTPIHNLRPSRETCEKCHWPEKFFSDKLVVKPRYLQDRDNSKTYNVYILRIGSGGEGGKPHGIHWHVSSDVRIYYRSIEDKREDIYEVEVQYLKEGDTVRYYKKGVDVAKLKDKSSERRLMDCIDCHNRPTHIYDEPKKALDRAISEGKIDLHIPWIKQAGLNALTWQYKETSKDSLLKQMERIVYDFYREKEPEVMNQYSDELRKSISEIKKIYADNIFPGMNIGWGTYKNHLGHAEKTGGCLRCHDKLHINKEGKAIRFDCNMCHLIIAKQAYSPRILKMLK